MIRRKRTRTYEPSQKPPRWLKPLNAAFLLMRPFGGMSTLHVLTVTGRRTGRPRSTPVTVVTVDDNRYLLEGFPGADWAANVRAANGYAQLSVGGRIEHVDLIELDPTDAIVVLRHWPQQAATGARIMRDAGVVDDITPDAFADLAGRCTVFRVHTAAPPEHGKETNTVG
jgi:deazaflavin-dependent oxidoreductase (nitroreductase family)